MLTRAFLLKAIIAILVAAIYPTLAAPVQAATCWPAPSWAYGPVVHPDGIWVTREDMCNNRKCGWQQPCHLTSTTIIDLACTQPGCKGATQRFKLSREYINPGGKQGFPTCWDATE